MKPFTRHEGVAVPMDALNIDTDQILPARYLRKRKADPDYHLYLFHDLRFDADGAERPDFILNQPAWRGATVIVGNENFGGGSSREAAAFALDAYGMRCVIAPSFGDIFFSNCLKNGILPVRTSNEACARLRKILHARPGATLSIDLEAQTVTDPEGGVLSFDLDSFAKRNLMKGLSPIGLTMEHDAEIAAFEKAYAARAPWAAL